jgi:hypothetical protein
MIPTFTSKTTSRNNTDLATPYTTSSITPTAQRLLVAFVHSIVPSGSANTPTLSGGIATWTLADSTIGSTLRKLSAFYGLTGDAPTPGAVTISFAGQMQNNCEWSIVEVDGCALTGTNGADAIAQTQDAATITNVTSFSTTLPGAFGHVDNRVLAGFVSDQSSGTFVAGTNFIMMGQVHGSGSSCGLGIEHGRDLDLVVDMSLTGGSANPWRAVALEIVGLVGAAPSTATLPALRQHGLNHRIN